MIAQLQEFEATEDTRGSRRVVHLVTLVHHDKGLEASLTVETATDSFSDVWREIHRLKAERRLFGYDVTETMALAAPF